MNNVWIVGFLVVAALVLAARWRPRRGGLPVDPRDRAELDAVGAALLAEHAALVQPRLAQRLRTLAGRRTPVSAVEPTGIRGQWVLRFADSTPLVVRERRTGDLALLGARLLTRRVNLASYEVAESGVVVALAWPGGRLRVLAVA